MHVFLWDAKVSELYMHPLVQQPHRLLFRGKYHASVTKCHGNVLAWHSGKHSMFFLIIFLSATAIVPVFFFSVNANAVQKK